MPYMMLLDNANLNGGGVVLRRVATATALRDKDDGDNSSGGGGGGGSSSRAATATATKAQARRAQVRKAQIQHRQRKANYTKQLEMDIAKLRDGIARVEGEGAVLRSENNTIRQRLTLAGVATPPPPIMGTTATTAPATATTTSWTASTSSPSPPVTQYTVSLDMSETNSPAYQVYRTSGSTPPSGGSIPGRGFPGSSSDASGPTALTAMEGVWDESGGGSSSSSKGFNLTEAQSDYAINFILAYAGPPFLPLHPLCFITTTTTTTITIVIAILFLPSLPTWNVRVPYHVIIEKGSFLIQNHEPRLT